LYAGTPENSVASLRTSKKEVTGLGSNLISGAFKPLRDPKQDGLSAFFVPLHLRPILCDPFPDATKKIKIVANTTRLGDGQRSQQPL
jgi:hypothetical protein